MGLFAVLDSTFASLVPHPVLFVMIISLFVTFLITVLNMLLIKKEVRQKIKTDMKHFQEEMKKAQHEKNMKRLQELQKGQLEVQMLHMRESLKVSAISILFLWLIFAWLQHLYVPTTVVDENGTAVLSYNNQNYSILIEAKDAQSKTLTSEGKSYDLELKGFLVKSYKNNDVELYDHSWKIELDKDNKLKFTLVMVDVPVFGKLGLIGWYILTAFAFGIIFRKIFD